MKVSLFLFRLLSSPAPAMKQPAEQYIFDPQHHSCGIPRTCIYLYSHQKGLNSQHTPNFFCMFQSRFQGENLLFKSFHHQLHKHMDLGSAHHLLHDFLFHPPTADASIFSRIVFPDVFNFSTLLKSPSTAAATIHRTFTTNGSHFPAKNQSLGQRG